MMNIEEIIQIKSADDTRFSNSYASIVNHLYSRPSPCGGVDAWPGVVRDNQPIDDNTRSKRIKEELVRCIWYGKHYNANILTTDDGLRIEVLSPGYWNVEDGPDFHHAEIVFSNSGTKRGDVEIHVFAADWKRHGHGSQETYNNVCLHVAMWNDAKEPFVHNKNGNEIPQLILQKYIDGELDELFESIDIDKYPHSFRTDSGPCSKHISIGGQGNDILTTFLDLAGDERVAFKARRFGRRIAASTSEQILYEAVMEALGYKANKEPFLELAHRITYNDIRAIVPIDMTRREKVLYVQAALFGMAGLLPRQLHKVARRRKTAKEGTHDKETAAYLETIEAIWDGEISARLGKKPMNGDVWQFAGSRPANFPTRRIAAMSHVITTSLINNGLLRLILTVFERAGGCDIGRKQFHYVRDGIDAIFSQIVDDHWSYYYTFNSNRLPAPERLIGKARSADILINVILPVLLVNAKNCDSIALERTLHSVFRAHPKLASNNTVRFMERRIFGNEGDTGKIVNNVRRQQGLHQIFNDFCDSDNHLCNKCALYLMFNKRDYSGV